MIGHGTCSCGALVLDIFGRISGILFGRIWDEISWGASWEREWRDSCELSQISERRGLARWVQETANICSNMGKLNKKCRAGVSTLHLQYTVVYTKAGDCIGVHEATPWKVES